MRLRKIADEAEARRILAEVAKSGKELREWAKANGVDGRSLQAWKLAFARRGSERSPFRPGGRSLEREGRRP